MLRRPAEVLSLLLLLALTVVAAEYYRAVRGPFFFGPNQDPSYSYLFGSLRLALHGETSFYHHPGMPTQGLGAAVLACGHWVAGRVDDLARDVLEHPEAYLRAIQATNLAMVVAALAALGVFAWRRSGFSVALFFLATPFFCTQSLAGLSQVGPEGTLFLAALAMSGATWFFVTTAPVDERPIAAVFGVLAALAVTTRVSALPFVLIPPLLLRNWRSRAVFIGTAALGSGIMLIPLLRYSDKFYSWVLGLGRRTGGWGSKPRSLLDTDLYIEGFVTIFHHHHALFAALALAISVWLWGCFRRHENNANNLSHRALGGVIIGQIALVLLVTKNPASRYLVPATALVGLDLALVWAMLRDTTWWRNIGQPGGTGTATGRRWCTVAALLLLPILLELPQHRRERDRLRRGVEGHRAIAAEMARLPEGCAVASFFRASYQPLALHFGHRVWPKFLTDELAELYPQELFYNFRRRGFESFARRIPAAEVARSHPCLALWGHFRADLAPLEVRRTSVESLYRVSSLAAVVTLDARDADAGGSTEDFAADQASR